MSDKDKIFGGQYLDEFQIGDFISWGAVSSSKREYGLIIDISIESTENRKVAFAKIKSVDSHIRKLPLLVIKLESGVKRNK